MLRAGLSGGNIGAQQLAPDLWALARSPLDDDAPTEARPGPGPFMSGLRAAHLARARERAKEIARGADV